MKEFKFRIWDSENKRFSFFEFPLLKGFETTTSSEKNVITQFVEKKDKNGLDIYSGDILLVSRYHTTSSENPANVFHVELVEDGKEVGKVIWIPCSYLVSFEHIRYDDTVPLSAYGSSHRYEIIGNIFETPELVGLSN